MQINGPDGFAMEVNKNNEAEVNAVTSVMAARANKNGNAYSVLVDVTSASTDDDFFYLKNKDDRDLVIYKIEGWCDDASQEIKVLVGGTDAGTDAGDALTPVNMRSGCGNLADVDCTQDATDLAVTGGSAITLLKFHATALLLGSWDFPAGIRLMKNQRCHMEAALAGLINLNIFFYFEDDV